MKFYELLGQPQVYFTCAQNAKRPCRSFVAAGIGRAPEAFGKSADFPNGAVAEPWIARFRRFVKPLEAARIF